MNAIMYELREFDKTTARLTASCIDGRPNLWDVVSSYETLGEVQAEWNKKKKKLGHQMMVRMFCITRSDDINMTKRTEIINEKYRISLELEPELHARVLLARQRHKDAAEKLLEDWGQESW